MRINGATLKVLREFNGLNLAGLKERAEVSASYICELERGREADVRPPTAVKLAKALGVPVAALCCDPKDAIAVAATDEAAS